LQKVVDWQEVWSIRFPDGWVLYADDKGQQLVPVWPARAFAEACCTNEWAECTVEMIPLSEWLSAWIPGMIRDGRAVAAFPLPDDRGMIVEPKRMATDLRETELQYVDDK